MAPSQLLETLITKKKLIPNLERLRLHQGKLGPLFLRCDNLLHRQEARKYDRLLLVQVLVEAACTRNFIRMVKIYAEWECPWIARSKVITARSFLVRFEAFGILEFSHGDERSQGLTQINYQPVI